MNHIALQRTFHIALQRTFHITISHYKLNLPFSERRLLLVLGDVSMCAAATGVAFWMNALFV